MPTPKAGYFTESGEKVPGTTTVIGNFKDGTPLYHYYYKRGRAGLAMYEHSEAAAEIGTVAHAMVEMDAQGKDPIAIATHLKTALPDLEMQSKAMSAFNAYLSWKKNFGVQIIEQEIQLVSEKHRYGGTIDAIGIVGNQLVLLDWKTSSGIYEDYLVQLAAYAMLWEENRPQAPITGGFHLLRFSKEHGDFEHRYFAELETAKRQFLLFREAYENRKELKKRAA